MHRIKLKEGSKPQKCGVIRLAGSWEAAFRTLINKLQVRGRPKNSLSQNGVRGHL